MTVKSPPLQKPVIGLTGGIASGKSTVAEILVEFGGARLDADRVAREVVRPDRVAWRQIVAWLGTGILDEDREIKRPELAARIFADPEARERLNRITHPRIAEVTNRRVARFRRGQWKTDAPFLTVEIPLLYEAGRESLMDEVWVVWVDRETQRKRLMSRDDLDEEAADQRIDSQMSLDEKSRRADIVIDNSRSLDFTRRKVQRELERLLDRPVQRAES